MSPLLCSKPHDSHFIPRTGKVSPMVTKPTSSLTSSHTTLPSAYHFLALVPQHPASITSKGLCSRNHFSCPKPTPNPHGHLIDCPHMPLSVQISLSPMSPTLATPFNTIAPTNPHPSTSKFPKTALFFLLHLLLFDQTI